MLKKGVYSADAVTDWDTARQKGTPNRIKMLKALRDAEPEAFWAEERAIAAAAEATAAPAWAGKMRVPCTPWGDVARAAAEQQTAKVADGGSLYTRSNTRELADAMAHFSCCQAWKLCEVAPQEL